MIRLRQLKAFTAAMDLGISIFHISASRVALRNLGVSTKTDWSVIGPLFLLLKTLAVGSGQHSKSIERGCSQYGVRRFYKTVLILAGIIACKVSHNLSSCHFPMSLISVLGGYLSVSL